jgi:uncharacterized protein (DUF2237 family)
MVFETIGKHHNGVVSKGTADQGLHVITLVGGKLFKEYSKSFNYRLSRISRDSEFKVSEVQR